MHNTEKKNSTVIENICCLLIIRIYINVEENNTLYIINNGLIIKNRMKQGNN